VTCGLGPPLPSSCQPVPFHAEGPHAGVLPEKENAPAATSWPPYSASASTSPSKPAPSGAKELPFQRAMQFAATPPAVKKSPPTIRSLPTTRRARPLPAMPGKKPPRPLPHGDQAEPFQRAMPGHGRPPAESKVPAA